jgi:type VI protein secretion system component VasF
MQDDKDQAETLLGHAQRQSEALERLLRLHYAVVVFAVLGLVLLLIAWLGGNF